MPNPQPLHLAKLHGLGNDFLVAFDAPTTPVDELARRVCARHHGVGADGLLSAAPGADPDHWTMTLHNADGSRAEMSGNGIRCFAHAVLRRQERGGPVDLHIETDAGERLVQVLPDRGDDPDTMHSVVDMGVASAGSPLPPGNRPDHRRVHQAATFDLGNPHLVLLVDDPSAVDVAVEGPAWESLFAGGMNVHFVTAHGDARIEQVTWERGAGVTEACGTGASAAAAAAHRWGLVATSVRVEMPGGSVEVELGDHIRLTGPSTWIADLEVRS